MGKYDSIRKVLPQDVVAFRNAHPGLTYQEIAQHFSKRGKTITRQRIWQILDVEDKVNPPAKMPSDEKSR